MSGINTPAAVVPVEIDASALETAADNYEIAKIIATEKRKEFVACLPIASVVHMAVLLECARNGTAIPEGYQPDKFIRLTDTQKAELKKANEERSAWLTKNRGVVMKEVEEDAGDLTGYTIRVGSKSTITKLTFTKSHGEKPSGKVTASKVTAAYKAVAEQAAAETAEST